MFEYSFNPVGVDVGGFSKSDEKIIFLCRTAPEIVASISLKSSCPCSKKSSFIYDYVHSFNWKMFQYLNQIKDGGKTMKGMGGIIAIIVGLLLLMCAIVPFFLKVGFKLVGLAFDIVSILGLLVIIMGIILYIKAR